MPAEKYWNMIVKWLCLDISVGEMIAHGFVVHDDTGASSRRRRAHEI